MFSRSVLIPKVVWLIITVTTLLVTAQTPKPVPITVDQVTAEVYFSPRGGCTAAVVREIDCVGTGDEILLQGYSFTSRPISTALVKAVERGVTVRAVLDAKTNDDPDRTEGDELAEAGATVLWDKSHAIAHDKVMTIGTNTVITGSFNWSAAAEKSNGENLLVLRGKELTERYRANWRKHRDHAVRAEY